MTVGGFLIDCTKRDEEKVADGMNYEVREGDYEKLGVQHRDGVVTFTFEGKKEDHCSILFYGKNQEIIAEIEVPEAYCKGSIRSVSIRGAAWKRLKYNYKINGIVVVDAYAERIIGRERWNDARRRNGASLICGGCVSHEFDWREDRQPEVPRSQMVMYKLHVRGFSMDESLHEGLSRREKGTFAAVAERIPYLKELGVTTLELMPAYEFEEVILPKRELQSKQNEDSQKQKHLTWESHEDDLIKPLEVKQVSEKQPERVNYWGYVSGNYFAPKESYSSSGSAATELKDLIRRLHECGMECVMEFFFPDGMNQNMILDVLRFWVKEYHVDGFHLLGTTIPVTAAAQDLWLSRTKLFYTGFDWMLLEQKTKYPHLFLYSDEYLYPARKLLNHMSGSLEDFLCQQRKQHEVQGFVNYIDNHNGFTLSDVFCYCEKHNESNGEDNCDGMAWNFSSNYGVEGKTRRRYVNRIRRQQMRNALAMLFLAQGVPLLLAGDEFANSQNGNNNAYCQDNRIGWLNWKNEETFGGQQEFVRQLATFRRAHPMIAQDQPMQMSDYKKKGVPDLSYHTDHAWASEILNDRQAAGVLYNEAYAVSGDGAADSFIYVGYNFHSGKVHLALPKLPKKKKWYLLMNTAQEQAFVETEVCLSDQHILAMDGQTICILIGK